ncbi:Ribonuclease H domain [Dillenia turbinata]|uniref:Ribonuclease H domain n=1 Tax=Dillenia turbinata TaxID=194707 RepID=A0AAN8VT40_9MAGN
MRRYAFTPTTPLSLKILTLELINCPNYTTNIGYKAQLSNKFDNSSAYSLALGVSKTSTDLEKNRDGSSLGHPQMTGAGGLLGDHNECWVAGFLSEVSSYLQRLNYGLLREGLSLENQKGIKSLIIRTDSMIAPKLIEENINNHASSSFIDDCRLLIGGLENHQGKHVYYKANFCAYLARMGANSTSNLFAFESYYPSRVALLYCYDLLGSTLFSPIEGAKL